MLPRLSELPLPHFRVKSRAQESPGCHATPSVCCLRPYEGILLEWPIPVALRGRRVRDAEQKLPGRYGLRTAQVEPCRTSRPFQILASASPAELPGPSSISRIVKFLELSLHFVRPLV